MQVAERPRPPLVLVPPKSSLRNGRARPFAFGATMRARSRELSRLYAYVAPLRRYEAESARARPWGARARAQYNYA